VAAGEVEGGAGGAQVAGGAAGQAEAELGVGDEGHDPPGLAGGGAEAAQDGGEGRGGGAGIAAREGGVGGGERDVLGVAAGPGGAGDLVHGLAQERDVAAVQGEEAELEPALGGLAAVGRVQARVGAAGGLEHARGLARVRP
jgi:hypothetical protein